MIIRFCDGINIAVVCMCSVVCSCGIVVKGRDWWVRMAVPPCFRFLFVVV